MVCLSMMRAYRYLPYPRCNHGLSLHETLPQYLINRRCALRAVIYLNLGRDSGGYLNAYRYEHPISQTQKAPPVDKWVKSTDGAVGSAGLEPATKGL